MTLPKPEQPSNAQPVGMVPPATRLAIVALWAQMVILVATSVMYLVRLTRSESTEPSLVLGSVALFLLAAAGVAAMAIGLGRGGQWARTPSVLWSVLLLPVGLSLFDADQALAGVVVLISAVTVIAGVILGARGLPGRR